MGNPQVVEALYRAWLDRATGWLTCTAQGRVTRIPLREGSVVGSALGLGFAWQGTAGGLVQAGNLSLSQLDALWARGEASAADPETLDELGVAPADAELARVLASIRETVRLLNVSVARMLTGTDLRAYGVKGDVFWAESLMHGLFLYELAERTGRGDPDEAYTAGLLRFIGRLAIDRLALEHGSPRADGVTFSDWEKNAVGFLHSQAGALLLAKWQFVESLVQATAGQDHPERLSQSNWLANALHFAASVLPSDAPGGAAAAPRLEALLVAEDGFMQDNGLSIDDVGRLLLTTREAFALVQSAF